MHRRTDSGENRAGEEVMPLRLPLVGRVLGEEMVTGGGPARNVKRSFALLPCASYQPLGTPVGRGITSPPLATSPQLGAAASRLSLSRAQAMTSSRRMLMMSCSAIWARSSPENAA